MIKLYNEYVSLTIDDNACLTSFEHLKMQTGNIITRPAPMFRAVLHSGDNWEDFAYSENAKFTVSGEGDIGTIHVSELNTEMGRFEIEMDLTVRLDGEKIYFDATVNNRSNATLNELVWPCFGRFEDLGGDAMGLYYPGKRLGCHALHVAEKLKGIGTNGGCNRMSWGYPASSMQWIMFNDSKKCFYISGRDENLMVGATEVLGSLEGDVIVEISKCCFVVPGETWKSPSHLMWLYEGPWQIGAEEYRAWTDTWRHPIPLKSWMKDMTGFCLVIFKQQYGDEVWSYHDLPKLYEIAQAHGCNTLGLFGWFDSGHDNFYPDLTVSESMGGEKALRDGIEKVHEMGGRVVLYFQGHLIDVNTPYFMSGEGLKVAGKNYVGQPYYEHYCKYSQSEFNRYYGGRTFATACPSSPEWHELLAEKADWIYNLGADGVLFDQMGGIIPYPCYDTSHGHEKPSLSFGAGRLKLYDRVRRTIDSHEDFCLMVEIMTDAYSQYVDCVHAAIRCGTNGERLKALSATGPMSYGMPELYRHIFPESKLTHRIAKPYMAPDYINAALCYGAMYEFEIRYLVDRKYVENDIHPEWNQYACAVTELRKRYADLLLTGRYSCNVELAAANPALLHGFFTADDGSTCVVFYNHSSEELPIDICGRKATHWENATESGKEIPTTLAPKSIIIIFFE